MLAMDDVVMVIHCVTVEVVVVVMKERSGSVENG